ncbi:MAG: hypothetical protein EZS28_022095 [Streblomastix strix]|uniref:Uncharacterized protein n=1 Tax=Streblomastix strix TaxID=222440 RepID=A0A5J4VIS4_9EUKA|nr:MAG: hypothetical protein EZS28_022095 [Streblomastix strix]
MADLNHIWEKASKYERELILFDDVQIFGFQLNNFGAHPTTGECDMIKEDAVAVQLFFFTIHHAARILAGEAQQKRELPLVNDQIKESIGKDYNAFSDLEKLSKDRIKLQYKQTISEFQIQLLQFHDQTVNYEKNLTVEQLITFYDKQSSRWTDQNKLIKPENVKTLLSFWIANIPYTIYKFPSNLTLISITDSKTRIIHIEAYFSDTGTVCIVLIKFIYKLLEKLEKNGRN